MDRIEKAINDLKRFPIGVPVRYEIARLLEFFSASLYVVDPNSNTKDIDEEAYFLRNNRVGKTDKERITTLLRGMPERIKNNPSDTEVHKVLQERRRNQYTFTIVGKTDDIPKKMKENGISPFVVIGDQLLVPEEMMGKAKQVAPEMTVLKLDWIGQESDARATVLTRERSGRTHEPS